MAIDKALYEMPEGLEALALEEAPIEIEIEDPESVTIGVGGLELEIEPGDENEEEEFDSNLAEFMKEGDLQKVASDVMEMVEADITSRKDWADTYVKGLDVLGLRYDEVTEPQDYYLLMNTEDICAIGLQMQQI